MNIQTAEKILGVSYTPGTAYNNRGKIYQFFVNLALRKIRRKVAEGNSVLSGVEDLSEKLGLEYENKYQSKFKQLLRDYKKERPSFIFYGDHKFTLEPLLFFMGLPDEYRSKFNENWKKRRDSGLRLVGSDMFLLMFPEVEEVLLPVVLRDSKEQYDICKKEFVDKRRENRGALSEYAIEDAAKYLAKGDRTLVIFPQGHVGNDDGWKTGIIRIMDKIMERELERARNIYLVPVSCSNLEPGDFVKTIYRALANIIGVVRHRKYKVNFGKPQSVEDFLGEQISKDKEFEEIRACMKHKVLELEQDYSIWAKEREQRKFREKFPLKDLRELLGFLPLFVRR